MSSYGGELSKLQIGSGATVGFLLGATAMFLIFWLWAMPREISKKVDAALEDQKKGYVSRLHDAEITSRRLNNCYDMVYPLSPNTPYGSYVRRDYSKLDAQSSRPGQDGAESVRMDSVGFARPNQ